MSPELKILKRVAGMLTMQMGKQSGYSMTPKEPEQAPGSLPGGGPGLAESMLIDLEERSQRNFPSLAGPSYSSEGRKEWDLLHRIEVRVCSVEAHLQSPP